MMSWLQIGRTKNLQQNFNNETKLSGKEWVQSLLRWRDLQFRNPEPTVVSRVMAFNKIKVTQTYDKLLAVYDVYEFGLSSIFTVDDSGFSGM
jgi:hypothetical protein